jgi:hypothetical protein
VGDLGTVESASLDRTVDGGASRRRKLGLREYKTIMGQGRPRGPPAQGEIRHRPHRGLHAAPHQRHLHHKLHIRIGTFGDEAYSRRSSKAVNAALRTPSAPRLCPAAGDSREAAGRTLPCDLTRVAPSGIHGNGLFTLGPVAKGTPL